MTPLRHSRGFNGNIIVLRQPENVYVETVSIQPPECIASAPSGTVQSSGSASQPSGRATDAADPWRPHSAPAAAAPVAPDVAVVAGAPALLSLPHALSVSPAIAVADTVARTVLPNELRFTDPTF